MGIVYKEDENNSKGVVSPYAELDNSITEKKAKLQTVHVPTVITQVQFMPENTIVSTDKNNAKAFDTGAGGRHLTFYNIDSNVEGRLFPPAYYEKRNKLKEVFRKSHLVVITGGGNGDIDYKNSEIAKDTLYFYEEAVKADVTNVLFLCRSANILLHNLYGISIEPHLDECGNRTKYFGVKDYVLTGEGIESPITKNLDTNILKVPFAKNYRALASEIREHPDLDILVESLDGEDVHIITDKIGNIFILGHIEYEKESLVYEYLRDIKRHKDDPENWGAPDVPTGLFTKEGEKILKKHNDWAKESAGNTNIEWRKINDKWLEQHSKISWSMQRDVVYGNILNANYQLTGKDEDKKFTGKMEIDPKNVFESLIKNKRAKTPSESVSFYE